MLYLRACRANLDFNRCSIFRECLFSIKIVPMVEVTPRQILSTRKVSTPMGEDDYCYLENPDVINLSRNEVSYFPQQ